MKYYKIVIEPFIWHLKPFKINQVIQTKEYKIYGFLCFKFIIG